MTLTPRHPTLRFILSLVLIALAVLGVLQTSARWRYLTRGWPQHFPQPVADTALPPACINAPLDTYDADRRAWAMRLIAQTGFTWVRQRAAWAALEPAPGEYRWETWDAIVDEADRHHLRLIAVLEEPPAWAGSPPDPSAYARFAGAFAARYADHLTYYQIWHNPNLGDSWGGRADAYAYTELLAQAATAIRAADPDARIILGSLAPTVETGDRNYAEDLFLEMLYAAGAAPYFDIVAVQPYGFATGPDDRRVSRDILNFSRAILVRETLIAHGEAHKAIWASHFGWNSKPAAWPGPPSIWGQVDEATQTRYTIEALRRSEREWPWMGVMCLNNFQPRPETPGLPVPDAEEHWGFALVGPDDRPRPLLDALRAWATRPPAAAPGVYPAATELATFEGTWTLGPQGADIGRSGDRVRLTFEGTAIALTVRRGPYRAFLFVTVDGAPAPALPRDEAGRAYVVLYDPLAAVATVPLAEHLPYGRHTVEVIAERGWGQWALADWRIAAPADPTPARLSLIAFGGLGLVGLLLLLRSTYTPAMALARLRDLWAHLRARHRRLLAVTIGAVYLLAAWQTLGHNTYRRLGEGSGVLAFLLAAALFYLSPWAVLTLIAGGVTSLIAFLEPPLGLALTILAAPFYLHPLSLLGKSFALAELILLPTFAGWLLQQVGKRGERGGPPLVRLLHRSVGAFILTALLATLHAEHAREAWRELRLVIVEPALFYLMLRTLAVRQRRRVIDAFVAGACLVAVIGLVQYLLLGDVITAEGGIRRLRSIYGSPNNVGLYLGRAIPLMLAVVIWGGGATSPRRLLRDLRHSRRRCLYAIGLLPVSLACLLSFSRGAIILGLPAALLTMGLLAGRRWRRATLIALLLGLLALIPLFRTPRFAGLLNPRSGSAGFRPALWRSTWAMIRDHPLLGVGPDNFLYAYRTRYVLPSAWEEFNLSHPHNVVMDFTARLGVPGLLAFLAMQYAFWRIALPLRRHPDPERRALALGMMGAMADFLAHGLVDASYFVVDLAYAYFLALATVEALAARESTTPQPGLPSA